MAHKSTDELMDEILDMLGEERADAPPSGAYPEWTQEEEPVIATITEEPEAEPLPEIETQDWTDIGDGIERAVFKFSDLFYTPRHFPDHAVTCYKGYEDDAAELPPLYVPPTREFELFSLMLSIGNKTNLVGPTGCGKTMMTEYYSAKTGRPYLRINCDPSLDRTREFGQTHINVDEDGKQTTDFCLGRVPVFMQMPSLVVLDEVTRATGFANIMWQSMLDRGILALPELKDTPNAIIKAHEDCRMCAADNTKGNGDDMDKYMASNVQDASFINRWDVVVDVDYLTEKQEVELIKGLGGRLTTREVGKLARISNLFHNGFKSGELSSAFSPRNLVAICKMTGAGITLQQAIELNFVSRLPKSEISDAQENMRAVFGEH